MVLHTATNRWHNDAYRTLLEGNSSMIRPCVRLVAIVAIVFLGGASHAVPQAAWAAPTQQSAARILCVNVQGGPTSPPCVNGEAYTTIQAAVDAATSGDEIRIAQGVYVGSDATNNYNVVSIKDKNLTLIGGFNSGWLTPGAASDTIIDGEEWRRGISVQAASVNLAHLTVTRGRAPREGMHSSSQGGGIYADVTIDQTLSLVDIVLTGNVAWNDGGAIFAPEATIIMTQTLVRNNEASTGGGVYFEEGTLALSNSTIESNIAYGSGGGVFGIGAQVHMIDSKIINNRAYDGGGGGLYAFDLDAVDSVIAHNEAGRYGGGVLALAGRL
jgi:hypothetical protein